MPRTECPSVKAFSYYDEQGAIGVCDHKLEMNTVSVTCDTGEMYVEVVVPESKIESIPRFYPHLRVISSAVE